MRRVLAYIAVLLVALAVAAGCTHRARMIPDKKLKLIYFDMFVADQWLRDTPAARTMADTTLFFEPIFRKYGYTFDDYIHTVEQKVKSPEDFSQLLTEVSNELKKVSDADKVIIEAQEAIMKEIRKLKKYDPQDFSSDSSRWSGPKTLWPIFEEAPADSLDAESDTLKLAEPLSRIDDVRLLDGLSKARKINE